MSERYIQKEDLLKLAVAKLREAGLNQRQAERVAEVLVHADERGVHSHGVIRVQHYCQRIQRGGINTSPQPHLRRVSPSAAVYDADNGMGHGAMYEAMNTAITMARESAISLVALQNSSHCGALSYYVQQATDQRMIGIALTQTDKCVAPPGGAEQFFGTNPIAFGFPVQGDNPVICDMATSAGAFGKILVAQETGEPIPEGWAVDAKGEATRDPQKFASLLHFAGPKGYALALAIDVLTGVLVGGQYGPRVITMYGDYDKVRGLGSAVIAIDPLHFGNQGFLEQMASMVKDIHNLKPAKGYDQVMVPGEPEVKTQRQYAKQGIPITQKTYDYLKGNQH